MCLVLFAIAPTALRAAASDDMQSCAVTPADAAIPFCSRAIESGQFAGRDLAGLYLNRGLRFDGQGRYDRAIEDYDTAIRIDATFAKAFNNRAGAFYKKKDFDHAIADYGEAIRLDPQHRPAFVGRCAVYRDTGQLDRAIADCTAAVKLDPKSPFGYFNRAAVYLGQKNYQGAIADYTDTVRLAPGVWQPLRNRGVVYLLAGSVDLARADFDALMRLDAKSAEGLYGRGIVKLKKGDTAGGNADVAAAKAIQADIAEEWIREFQIDPRDAQTATVAPPAAAPSPSAEPGHSPTVVPAIGGVTPTFVSEYGIWGIYQAVLPGGKQSCFAIAQPSATQSVPKKAGRTPPYIFVASRPSDNVKNEISMMFGYPVKPDGVTMTAAGTQFRVLAQQTSGWVYSPADEKLVLDALRNGSELTIRGVTANGATSFVDTYKATAEFGKALQLLAQLCPEMPSAAR